MPQAKGGLLAAGTLAWARALGEFGPILVFAGTTRQKTEVLPTSAFLELQAGRTDGMLAVSLIMIAAAAIVFKQGELTIGQNAEPVLATIEMPEVDIAIGSPADAASPKATQRHAVIGAVIEIAGITNRVGLIPVQSKRPAPAGLRSTPDFRTGTATQQRTQSSQSKRSHAEAESRPSLPDLNALCLSR